MKVPLKMRCEMVSTTFFLPADFLKAQRVFGNQFRGFRMGNPTFQSCKQRRKGGHRYTFSSMELNSKHTLVILYKMERRALNLFGFSDQRRKESKKKRGSD